MDEDCPFTRHWEVITFQNGPNTTPGAGKNGMLPIILGQWPPPGDPKLIVMSDDDMLWRPNAGATLERFWSHRRCPDNLAILSALLEPEYPWNTPRETVHVGGIGEPTISALVRDSAPGAAWTFRYGGCSHGIGPHFHTCQHLPDGVLEHGRRSVFVDDFGYDYEYCGRLRAVGLTVAQIDLAEHIGGDMSTHGNRAHEDVRCKPLDRERWGV
jgi:hypothetical protein